MKFKIIILLLINSIVITGIFEPLYAEDIVLKNISLNGFVDSSYTANLNTKEAGFTFDQFEFDVEKKIEGLGALRADINFGTGNGLLTTDSVVEQGYITIEKKPVTFIFGKFNAPIGFELLDAPDMYQLSHAMVFDSGLPTNLTGASISGSMSIVDLIIYVANGWDQIDYSENNEETVGTRLGLTPIEGLNIGFSYITGDEKGKSPSPELLSVFDVDLTFTMVPNLTIGAEFNSGTHKKNSALKLGTDDAKWSGYLVMANYSFNDMFGLTARYDAFNDSEGARLKKSVPVDETRQSFTISPSIALGNGFGGLLEYRYTSSDKDVFVDSSGKAMSNNSTLATEFTYTF